MPVRMFAYGNLSHGTDRLVMRPEIANPADLKGKKVAVMVGGLPQIMMGIYLEKNGLPFDWSNTSTSSWTKPRRR